MVGKEFSFRPETLKRCRLIELSDEQAGRFCQIGFELFGYLYQVAAIDFSIYFRAGDKAVEFIKPQELSKELLDEVARAVLRPLEGLSVCILKKDRPALDRVISKVRQQKIDALARREPGLDRKVIDLYGNLSSTSQMVVEGGIDGTVAAAVKASAAFLVTNQLDSDATIDTISRMIHCDPTLYDHSASVAIIATVIATHHLKKPLSKSAVQIVAQCALFHDVGKTCVPNAILNKPGRFTPEEFEVMKTHTTLGSEELQTVMNRGVSILPEAIRVALEHHEKFEGGGYPHGRKGRLEDDPDNGIHLYSRIVSIADVYSALLMKRIYKEAFAPQDAIKVMFESGSDFDPEVFSAFVRGVVSSLNAQQKQQQGRGRILEFDDEGQLCESKKPN